MASIEVNSLVKENRKEILLQNWTVNFEKQTISSICADKKETIELFFELLNGRAKISSGSLTLNGLNSYKERKKIASLIGNYNKDGRLGNHGTVKQIVAGITKKDTNDTTEDQAERMISQFKIPMSSKLTDLAEGQKQQLEIMLLLLQRFPILLLDNPTDEMSPEQQSAIWQLLRDYARKTGAVILFTSSKFQEMQRFADQIVYVQNVKIKNVRSLPTHDSVDCVVTITGAGFPIELAQNIGAHMLGETDRGTKIIFSGNVQALLPLLEKTGITDVRIEDATIEDELMMQ